MHEARPRHGRAVRRFPEVAAVHDLLHFGQRVHKPITPVLSGWRSEAQAPSLIAVVVRLALVLLLLCRCRRGLLHRSSVDLLGEGTPQQ